MSRISILGDAMRILGGTVILSARMDAV